MAMAQPMAAGDEKARDHPIVFEKAPGPG